MSNKTPIPTAIIYCRFSPRRNSDTCLSVERQDDLCTDFCHKKGWHILGRFADSNKSGASMDRPGLLAAIDQAMAHQACLVVYSISRFARSVKDALILSEQLNEAGCNMASVTENIDTTTPMGRAFFGIMAVIHQLERETISERTSVAMKHRVKTGRPVGGSSPPYGWKADPANCCLHQVCEYEQAVIRQVILLKEAGIKRHTDICRWLNARQLFSRGGKEWVSNRNFRMVTKAIERCSMSQLP